MSLIQLKTPTKIIALLLALIVVLVAFNTGLSAQHDVIVQTDVMQSVVGTTKAYAQGVDGQCGSANRGTVPTQPAGSGACLSGAVTGMTYDSSSPAGWTWQCRGSAAGAETVSLAGRGVLAPVPSNCTLDGVTVNHGDSYSFFFRSNPSHPTQCSAMSRTCNDGALSGNSVFRYATCNNPVPPPINCSGTWSDWGSCSASCGNGQETQTFTVTSAAQHGGTCAELTSPMTRSCYEQPCMNITAGSCNILTGSSTCPVGVSWTSSQTIGPGYSVRQGSSEFSDRSSGSTNRDLTFGSNVFRIYDLGWRPSQAVHTFSTNTICDLGNIWVDPICRFVIGPPLQEDVNIAITVVPDQNLFLRGTEITVAAEVNTDDNLICELTAFGSVRGLNTTAASVPVVNQSGTVTNTLFNQNTFSLTCDTRADEVFSDGTTTITITKVVDVIPAFEEI